MSHPFSAGHYRELGTQKEGSRVRTGRLLFNHSDVPVRLLPTIEPGPALTIGALLRNHVFLAFAWEPMMIASPALPNRLYHFRNYALVRFTRHLRLLSLQVDEYAESYMAVRASLRNIPDFTPRCPTKFAYTAPPNLALRPKQSVDASTLTSSVHVYSLHISGRSVHAGCNLHIPFGLVVVYTTLVWYLRSWWFYCTQTQSMT